MVEYSPQIEMGSEAHQSLPLAMVCVFPIGIALMLPKRILHKIFFSQALRSEDCRG